MTKDDEYARWIDAMDDFARAMEHAAGNIQFAARFLGREGDSSTAKNIQDITNALAQIENAVAGIKNGLAFIQANPRVNA